MIEMTLSLAETAARAALAHAVQIGVPMTVSVVDEAGRVVLTMRGDGTGFLTTDTSCAKAVAAASFRRPTLELAPLHANNPFWSNVAPVTHGQALPTGGAVPVILGGRVIGAIGCGGGTPEQDHDCAAAGANAVLPSSP
jgi:uncharacterized protein GlcG (DUF336 family)